MAIIKKIPTVSSNYTAQGVIAGLSLIALGLAGAAALIGWLPGQQRAASSGDDMPQVSSAPQATPIAAPVAAPAAAPAPDHSMQPRVRRAAHVTSAT